MSVIVGLEVENIKRIRAAGITPDGRPLVIVGGEENQGKSSILDSIQYALGGEDAIPAKPLRDGAKKGRIFVDLGDMTVERCFTEKGSRLVVKNKDGDTKSSPQGILDKLCGRLAFDPLEFSRQKPAEQLALMRELTGLNFTEWDTERAKAYTDRTAENRTVKQLEAEFKSLPFHADAPKAEVSVAALSDQLQVLRDTNAAYDRRRDAVTNNEAALKLKSEAVIKAEQSLVALEKQLIAARADFLRINTEYSEAVEQHNENAKAVSALAAADTAPLSRKLASAEATNQKVRDNTKRTETEAKLKAAQKASEALTARIEAIDAEKAAAIGNAKFPVDGLGFDENGITLNGFPFEQAASSQRLRVSAAMGLAMNPTLRIMLIRDGSLMGAPSLAMLAELATEHHAQVWIERVSVGEEVSVVIEDGAVKEDRTESPKEDAGPGTSMLLTGVGR